MAQTPVQVIPIRRLSLHHRYHTHVQSIGHCPHGSIPSVRARNLKLEAQLTKQRTAISRMGKRVIDRSKLMAARSVAKIPSSAIPFAGTVMLVSLTLIEFKQLCESLFDLKELYKEAELEEEVDADVLQTVCHPSGWFTDDVEEQ